MLITFTPKVIVVEEDGDNYLCTCKQSSNLKHFTEDQIGSEGIALGNGKST